MTTLSQLRVIRGTQLRHVCFVVYSRANYARIKTAILACMAHPKLRVSVIVGASGVLYRYGNVSSLIQKDGINIETELYNAVEGDLPIAMAKTTGLGLIDLSQEFSRLKPDLVVTVADRFETISTAIAASYMNIPLVHTQGGELTGSIDESVRHAISKLAHIHFPATSQAVKVLTQLGEDPEKIFLTGCPSIDIAKNTPTESAISVLTRYQGVGPEINQREPYLLVSQHPVTTEYQNAGEQIEETISAIEATKMQTVWLWPNMDSGSDSLAKKIRVYREKTSNSRIHFYRNFSAEDYINVMRGCAVIVGNSSSGIREANFLGIPSVNIGTRQSNREHGANVQFAQCEKKSIFEAIQLQVEHGTYPSDNIFGDGTAGIKMAEYMAKVDLNVQKKFYFK